jgi:hypothetical protein
MPSAHETPLRGFHQPLGIGWSIPRSAAPRVVSVPNGKLAVPSTSDVMSREHGPIGHSP